MKIISLLAGVAAFAMIAGSANAGDLIFKGQRTGSSSLFGTPVYNPGATTSNNGGVAGVANGLRALNGNSDFSAWQALGGATDDIGDAADDAGATFTLQADVSTACVYYSGNDSTETFDFGQLGIYASEETGPANAFTMVDDANLVIQTNLAGCNANNSVTLSRTVADMTTTAADGFDNAVFQDTLPYTVSALYRGSNGGTQAGGAGIDRELELVAGDLTESQPNGAWKSPMTLAVNIPVTGKALIAGEYEGAFTLTIQAD